MRGEKNSSVPINADGGGKFETVRLHCFPYLGGGEFRGFRCVKQPTDRDPRSKKLGPVAGMGKTLVVEKGLGFQKNPAPVNARGALRHHLYADTRQCATLGKVHSASVGPEKRPLGRIARPEGEGQRECSGILAPDGENLAVLTGPKVIRVHEADGIG